MKRTLCIGLLVLLGLVGCDDTPLTDLRLHNLEVTQGAAGVKGSAVLVSQRLTTVTAVLTSDSRSDVAGLVGALSVAVDGVIVTANVAAVNGPITVPAKGERSLEFVLEAPTGISASRDVDLFVTLSAPSQFLEGEAFDLTFDAPSIVANEDPPCSRLPSLPKPNPDAASGNGSQPTAPVDCL